MSRLRLVPAGRMGHASAFAGFSVLILGLFAYVPQLVLCWIGHRLAKHCAATLPPRRFWALGGLVSLGFAGAALATAGPTPARPRPPDRPVPDLLPRD